MTRKRQISKRFSEAAEYYHDNAEIQREIASDTAKLIGPGLRGRCLDLGCGSGFLAADLAQNNPELRVVGIDLAPGMIELAQKLYREIPNLSFLVGDCSSDLTQREMNFLVSSSSLQWMFPFEEALQRWAEALAPGGLMALSFMVPGTLAELRVARERVTGSKMADELPTLNEVAATISKLGLEVPRKFVKNYRATYAGVDELLADLRGLGVNAPLRDEAEAKMTPEELSAFKQELTATATPTGELGLNYEVGFVLAELPSRQRC